MASSNRDPSASLPPSSPAASSTPRSSLSETRSPPGRTPSLRLANMPNASAQHRQSFSELRGLPPSPRSQRHPSMSQLAVQELIDNPPRQAPDPKFAGRDWRTVRVAELTSPTDLKFVDVDIGVEEATKVSRARHRWRASLTQVYSYSSIPELLSYLFARTHNHEQSPGPLTIRTSMHTFYLSSDLPNLMKITFKTSNSLQGRLERASLYYCKMSRTLVARNHSHSYHPPHI